MLGGEIEASSVSFTLSMEVERSDLRRIEPSNSAEKMVKLGFGNQTFSLPPEIDVPLVQADPVMAKLFRSACMVFSNTSDGHFALGFNGGVGEGDGSLYTRFDVENLADETIGDWHHLVGFIRIESTIGGAQSPEHDISFDTVFRAAGQVAPEGIPMTFGWPDGAEATISPDAANK
jgi:hypothetical protein